MQKNTHKVLDSKNKILFTGTKNTCVEFVNNNVWSDGMDISAVLPLTESEMEVHNQMETDEVKEACFQYCKQINPFNPEKAAVAYKSVLSSLIELHLCLMLKCRDESPEMIKAKEAIELATK